MLALSIFRPPGLVLAFVSASASLSESLEAMEASAFLPVTWTLLVFSRPLVCLLVEGLSSFVLAFGEDNKEDIEDFLLLDFLDL